MTSVASELCVDFESMTPTEQAASGLSEELVRRIREGEISSGSAFVDFAVLRAESYDPELVARFRKIEEQIGSRIGHPALLVETGCFQVQQDHGSEAGTSWHTDTTLKTHALGIISGNKPVVINGRTWAIPTERYAYALKQSGKPMAGAVPAEGVHVIEGNLLISDHRPDFSSHAGSTSLLVHEQCTEPVLVDGAHERRLMHLELYIGSGAIARVGNQLAAQQHRLQAALTV